jgi:hypothetical protein
MVSREAPARQNLACPKDDNPMSGIPPYSLITVGECVCRRGHQVAYDHRGTKLSGFAHGKLTRLKSLQTFPFS